MWRDQITALIQHQTDMIVQTGPFAGMRLSPEVCWGDGDLAPRLLGTYEQELHPFLARAASRRYGAVVDIGCAEGYYAIGAARLFPATQVFAFDADPHARPILERNARLNGVAATVVPGGECSPGTLIQLAAAHDPLLIICDCEGHEVTLFSDPATQASVQTALRHSDLIVECHDFIKPIATAQCVATFSPTHLVEIVYSGGRNPNEFPFLSGQSDSARWAAVCENRPCLMNWVLCRSRHLRA